MTRPCLGPCPAASPRPHPPAPHQPILFRQCAVPWWRRQTRLLRLLPWLSLSLFYIHLDRLAFYFADNRLSHFTRAHRRGIIARFFQIISHVFFLGKHVRHSLFQTRGCVFFAKIPKHHHTGKNQGSGIHLVQPFVFWRRTVRGFKQSSVGADIGTGRDP